MTPVNLGDLDEIRAALALLDDSDYTFDGSVEGSNVTFTVAYDRDNYCHNVETIG